MDFFLIIGWIGFVGDFCLESKFFIVVFLLFDELDVFELLFIGLIILGLGGLV